MKREITFRAITTATDGWIYGLPYAVYTDNKIDSIQSGETMQIDYIKTDTLGQFTGFKDKNGVDIFEGDVLSDWNDIDGEQVQSFMQVFWCEKTGAWKLDSSFRKDMSSGDLLSEELMNFSYEITGNIFENPELLSVKDLALQDNQEMSYHQCPNCNGRCNCTDEPCSCCIDLFLPL